MSVVACDRQQVNSEAHYGWNPALVRVGAPQNVSSRRIRRLIYVLQVDISAQISD